MVFRINSDNTEVFTLETNVSRSIVGFGERPTTGSIYVIPRQLRGLRETYQTEKMIAVEANDVQLEELRKQIIDFDGLGDATERVQGYMEAVHQSPRLQKYNATASIFAFTPPTVFNSNAARRSTIQNMLAKQPTSYNQESNWSTTNYHCLNFFTSSNTPTSSVLIYPNKLALTQSHAGEVASISNTLQDVYTPDFLPGPTLPIAVQTAYQLLDAFTFDFWIKPKNNSSGYELWADYSPTTKYYRPGTILHYSGAYAITLHSGSSVDQNDNPDKFRICLQLAMDSTLLPDTIPYGVDVSGSYLGSTFWSSDNAISLTDWTHVAITYGGHKYNQGTGSIWINGVKDRDINIGEIVPVATYSYSVYSSNPVYGAIYVGNFYEGVQQTSNGPFTVPDVYFQQRRFWSSFVSFGPYPEMGPGDWESRDYYDFLSLYKRVTTDLIFPANEVVYAPLTIIAFNAIFGGDDGAAPPYGFPASYSFRYPLTAELHDIRLWAKQLSYDDIQYAQTGSTREQDIRDLRFWVPPFFVKESIPKFNEPITPFYSIGAPPTIEGTNDPLSSSFPFAARLAMSVNGYYPNLDNYMTDLITDTPPVAWDLRWWPEAVPPTTDITSDQWMYETLVSSSQIRKRLYTVLPNDHGNYKPGWNVLGSLHYDTSSFVNQYGSRTNGRINLDDSMYYDNTQQHYNTSVVDRFPSGILTRNAHNFLLAYNEDLTSSITNDILGARPEDVTPPQSFGLAIWQRMQTPDSQFVTVIDISNLYYGESIKPGTFEMKVSNMSGSLGNVSMTLRDNGRGGLYRADTTSEPAQWSTVGAIMYNEGVAIIKYPQLYYIAKLDWKITFRGQKNIYVYTIETFADPQTCTESTDPVFTNVQLPPQVDFDPAEDDRKQVYIGSVLIHDENLNVIARSQIAQPIVKRSSDKFMFRVKVDF